MNPRSLLRLFLLLALGPISCGADPAELEPRADPVQCSPAWQVIFNPGQERLGWPPNRLRLHRDRLYFAQTSVDEHGVRSMATTGGPVATLTQKAPFHFWVEDRGVIYIDEEGIRAVPLGGEPPETVVSTDAWKVRFPLAQGLDGGRFYWATQAYEGGARSWALRAQPRDGGPPAELVRVPADLTDSVRDVVPVGEQIVAIPFGGTKLRVIPRAGGEARLLPDGGELLGVGDDGALLWRSEEGGFDGRKGSDRYGVRLSRLDGRPAVPFWTGKPPNAFPRAAWSDGAAGFYVSAWEWAADDAMHSTVWWVDRDGRGRRLACAPEVKSSVETAAVGPDALYVIDQHSDFKHWSIVRIARPASL